MIVLDILFALLALSGVGVFLYIIQDFMRETSIPLISIFALVIGMAVFDFLREIARNAKSRRDGD
ncbi:MAG: hypothetical protein AAF899_11260 [Pseudomonadota bacterium]